jgi:hypothetical protein
MFDDFIVAPQFNRVDIKEYFRKNKRKKGVYAFINNRLEPLYIGSTIDLPKRIPHHRY